MAHVLVFKNADFTTNRVAVISFDGAKHCTGIEFDETTIAVTGVTPVEVEYTVTPADTTDAIVWTSSDPSVATVEGGVVTILGIGSTTITATCGSYSDSLTLTADLYEVPDWYGTSTLKTATDTYGNMTADLTKVASGSQFNRIVAARDSSKTDYALRILDDGDYTIDNGMRPLKIPNNVERINISGTGLYNTGSGYAGASVIFMAATEPITYANTYTLAKGIVEEVVTVSGNAVNGAVSVPSGADSYFAGARLKSAATAGSDPATVAGDCNFVIHYLPALTE